jgi:hypothetical protein
MSLQSTGLSREERHGTFQSPSSLPDSTDPGDILQMVGSATTRVARLLIGCGRTTLNELIKSGELESYLDGSTRRITLRSIYARRERLIAATRERESARGQRGRTARRARAERSPAQPTLSS